MYQLIRFATILTSLVCAAAHPSTLTKRATCTVNSAGSDSVDDVPAIEAAMKSCGNGGIILLPAEQIFTIRSTWDFTGCTNCEVQIEGTLKLSDDDLDSWDHVKGAILLTNITGATIHSKTGSGVFEGNGVLYWKSIFYLSYSQGPISFRLRFLEFAADNSFKRPSLLYISGGSNITVENLEFRDPPNVFQYVTDGATNILYRGLNLNATPKDGATPKNTDGFDVVKATFVTITDTKVTNQDDCVAFKPGSNFITVTNITCSGSHGLSVGSLAKSENDVVTNIIVDGATMIDSNKATGIKLYDGTPGHGFATVRNVTFQNIDVQNSEYAAQILSCYDNKGTCIVSNHTIDGVYWKGIRGTTATKFDPNVADLNCPGEGICNIFFEDFTVKAPSGKANVLCSGVDSDLGVACSGSASG
ncbi:hypothetical protein PQX77_014212 [Marasmius sp. AFHP31]|nr:hypothetical protein PQX77_014212 [Marasmius sp. AFHP31]